MKVEKTLNFPKPGGFLTKQNSQNRLASIRHYASTSNGRSTFRSVPPTQRCANPMACIRHYACTPFNSRNAMFLSTSRRSAVWTQSGLRYATVTSTSKRSVSRNRTPCIRRYASMSNRRSIFRNRIACIRHYVFNRKRASKTTLARNPDRARRRSCRRRNVVSPETVCHAYDTHYSYSCRIHSRHSVDRTVTYREQDCVHTALRLDVVARTKWRASSFYVTFCRR